MRKVSLCLLAFLFIFSLGTPHNGAMAVGSCPNSKNGKCPAQDKRHVTRAQFTAAQREKMAVEFRKLCKKKYGAPSRLIKIDYYKRMYICSQPGY